MIEDGWAQKDKTKTGLNSYLELMSHGIFFWSQVSGWRIIGEKFSLNFDSTTVGRKASISKCSKNKSCKFLSTVYTQALTILFRLLGVDNEIQCFVNVCERTTEVRDSEWFIVWGTIFFWVPIRFYWKNCVTSHIQFLALSTHLIWISQDYVVGREVTWAGTRTIMRIFWEELHTKMGDLLVLCTVTLLPLRPVEMSRARFTFMKSAVKEDPMPSPGISQHFWPSLQ